MFYLTLHLGFGLGKTKSKGLETWMLIVSAKNQSASTHLRVIILHLKISKEGNIVKKQIFPKRDFFVLISMEKYSGQTQNLCYVGR